jgi:NADH:ubiquinone oxidoreductase subunit 3 (subunit A)
MVRSHNRIAPPAGTNRATVRRPLRGACGREEESVRVRFDDLVIASFVVLGGVFVAVTLAASWLLSPKRKTDAGTETYECGVEPVGSPWVQFRVGYYVYALLFVIFDIETVFLYPWAVAFGKFGWFILTEMVVFVAVLAVGLAYAWKEGALKWH